eukprot:gene11653-biopygen6920
MKARCDSNRWNFPALAAGGASRAFDNSTAGGVGGGNGACGGVGGGVGINGGFGGDVIDDASSALSVQ